MSLSVDEVIARLGGVARRGDLIAATSRAAVDARLRDGSIVAVGRGVYAGVSVRDDLQVAASVCGTLSHLSAALHHGWAVKTVPERPEVIVPRGRRITTEQHRVARIMRADLGPDDVRDAITSADRTIVDCLKREEFDSGLAVADSALRSGFSPHRLAALTRDARGHHALRARRVAARATPEAANPFESVLRAIGLGVPALHLRPQVPLFGAEFLGRPDLVDTELRIIAEADSFEWHGNRAALRADARRYDEFIVHGWLVLRFAWEDVMLDPGWVRSVLVRAVAQQMRVTAS